MTSLKVNEQITFKVLITKSGCWGQTYMGCRPLTDWSDTSIQCICRRHHCIHSQQALCRNINWSNLQLPNPKADHEPRSSFMYQWMRSLQNPLTSHNHRTLRTTSMVLVTRCPNLLQRCHQAIQPNITRIRRPHINGNALIFCLSPKTIHPRNADFRPISITPVLTRIIERTVV